MTDNTRTDGSPDWDKVMRAVMQHRNTPLNDINLSPAQIMFGRPIRDFLPVKPGLYRPADVWVDNAEKRELALKKRLYRGQNTLNTNQHYSQVRPCTFRTRGDWGKLVNGGTDQE